MARKLKLTQMRIFNSPDSSEKPGDCQKIFCSNKRATQEAIL